MVLLEQMCELSLMAFVLVVTEEMTEELLELHDREVMKVKHYYEENKDMLTNVSRRQKLWVEFLEVEVSVQ